MTLLNGNQTMILMTAFIKWKNTDKINGNQFVGSISFPPMMMELARATA
jgi:hypothetical protein